MAERTKYILDESEMPTTWYNIVPDLPAPPPPPLHPGTHEPVGPDDLAPLFAMALIGQEVSGDRLHRHPRCGARRVHDVASDPALPGAPVGEGSRHPGSHLLQVRGRQPGRVAQAQHRGAPGVLQRRGGDRADHHRDRCRSMGQRTRPRLQHLRSGLRGVAGARLFRPEAVPQGDDGNLGGGGPLESLRPHRGGTEDPGRESRQLRAASGSPSPRRWRRH